MARTGGGYGGSQHKDVKAWKTEPKPKAIDPASVSTIGVSTQFKKPALEMGPGYRQSAMPPTGIPNATKGPAGAGPGGFGRTIYKSGSQMQYGPTAPSAVNRAPDPSGTGTRVRDILKDFGPERGR